MTLLLGERIVHPTVLSIPLDSFPDIKRLADLSIPWPEKDSSYQEILSEQEIQLTDDLMGECYRVLEPGGVLKIKVKGKVTNYMLSGWKLIELKQDFIHAKKPE